MQVVFELPVELLALLVSPLARNPTLTIRGGRGSAPNCTDGELLDDESTSAEIPEPQIDGTRDLWM